jgi:cyclic beta-1,2-glucan synthetase
MGKSSKMRIFDTPSSRIPEVHLLSNGRYHVVVSNAGGGYSRWRDLAVTRWREDATRDCWGYFFYLRDSATGKFWSVAYQPTLCPTERYEVRFGGARADFRQHHGDLEIRSEICVSREKDVELRRVILTNHSGAERSIEVTSYAEIVLAVPAADAAHPVFSNLFVQTEFVQENQILLCTRRPRAEDEMRPWLLHMMVGEEGATDRISFETDRARFIGRGRTPVSPKAMLESRLSNTVGSVLDPVVSLRRTFRLASNQTLCIDFVLGVAETREAALSLVENFRDPRVIDRAFDSAESDLASNELGATEADLDVYGRLAGALVYADPTRRAPASVLLQNRRGQRGLWSHGISGDIPIVLLNYADSNRAEIVKQLIQAHQYWRTKGLATDLVILTPEPEDSPRNLRDRIIGFLGSEREQETLERSGGIFIRHLEKISGEDRALFESAARVVLSNEYGSLAEQLLPDEGPGLSVPLRAPTRSVPGVASNAPPRLAGSDPSEFTRAASSAPPARELLFNNELGGFSLDGSEYVVTLQPGNTTPVPWVNVLANPSFGTVISESGSAYTWAENSHEFRLTPWNNDPVTDAAGECFYIRDEESGGCWSPTPLPTRGTTGYVARHGFGYSVFEHAENGIISELTVYVAIDSPVKFAVLKLGNVSGHPRRLSVTGYWEWVLGDLRQRNLLHVQTELDPKSGALLARNFYNTDFSEWIAFVDAAGASRTFTGDRNEFLGRNGNISNPAALQWERLSGRTGVGLDPCAAVQVVLDLADGQEHEIRFCLGAGRDLTEVQNLTERYREPGACRAALDAVRQYWKRTLGAVHVETPDPSVNLMANGWLLYQTLSCRLWGRTGFYQSGGAFGFRDQLQDAMALVVAEPAVTREHLLRAAAYQFREGDVEHWWHPPTGRGVRTRVSDDYLWLPYVTYHYISHVGDVSILDEKIPFLKGRPLKPGEEAYYDLPSRSEESATLYEHCVRAIEHGLKFGKHGLPLIGSCDWNDGMNLVGIQGKGESVWLAFFLYDVLMRFSNLARMRNEFAFADRCIAHARQLKENVERSGWDGKWYRRAYFDSGEPLGSESNQECQIDSLPQSWSVISGAGDPDRARLAMRAVEERLVRTQAKLIQLLDPPFDRSALNPGYIKGYVPGVRENGGQYTHAAVWVTMAFALLGDDDRAWELFAMLNPVNHGSTFDQISTYKVEPYVVAADVYAVAPHTGRGGWTWYTGSAGWLYRLLSETLLGLNLEGNQLRLSPRLPHGWATCKIDYRYCRTTYHIVVSRGPHELADSGHTFLDGRELTDAVIPLVDDQREHDVEMRLAATQ